VSVASHVIGLLVIAVATNGDICCLPPARTASVSRA